MNEHKLDSILTAQSPPGAGQCHAVSCCLGTPPLSVFISPPVCGCPIGDKCPWALLTGFKFGLVWSRVQVCPQQLSRSTGARSQVWWGMRGCEQETQSRGESGRIQGDVDLGRKMKS